LVVHVIVAPDVPIDNAVTSVNTGGVVSVVFDTVTETAADVATLPAASRTTAVSV
jgi:hypothetical protein